MEPPDPPPSGRGAVVRVELHGTYHLRQQSHGAPPFVPIRAGQQRTHAERNLRKLIGERRTSVKGQPRTQRGSPGVSWGSRPLGESLRLGRTADRPTSPRAGSTPRPSLCLGVAVRVANCPSKAQSVALALSGFSAPIPPTPCGLATFSAALASGLSDHDAEVGVVRVLDAGGQRSTGDRVVGELDQRITTSVVACSEALNQSPKSRWCSTSTASTVAPTETRCSKSWALSTSRPSSSPTPS